MRPSHLRALSLGTILLAGLTACGADTGTGPRLTPEEEARDLADARIAWSYVEHNSIAGTGLVSAVEGFQNVTVWDIASLIGAVYSAHELQLIDDAAYDARIRTILTTLEAMPLFEGSAFNKFYDGTTGQMVDRAFAPTTRGFGWAATDIGRLLIWLRVLADNQPRYADQAAAIVRRIDMTRIVKNGNLEAVDLDPATGATRYYAETGLGYEQYAAAGYALWGHRAVDALNASANVTTTTVFGVAIPIDKRGVGRLTSEPYVMMGLETGWFSTTLRQHATSVLAAQRARHEATGIMTIVSEDHLPDAPYYFYYYSLFNQGRSFVVDGPEEGTFVEHPRWVSTKAAFGWRALLPMSYTNAAVEAVRASAIAEKGWGSGVYEESGQPTGEANINTEALVLESLVYRRTGRPFLSVAIP